MSIDVIGIGEDGLEGLSAPLLHIIDEAEVLVGGDRHLDKAPRAKGERLTWGGGFDAALAEIEKRLDKKVVVLASGDPMNFGVGAMFVKRFGVDRVTIHPAPGAFSLAAARMGWSLPDCETLTVHGRPLETLVPYLAPGICLLVLSADETTPAAAARLIADQGYGQSRLTVLEHLGGDRENRITGIAADWNVAAPARLNTLAIECVLDAGRSALPRTPGLPDEAFEHDGQLTKRQLRAITLSALQPLPGQLLWDIGAGCGSIAIEWLRLGGWRSAVAIESHAERLKMIERNARSLGAVGLHIVEGSFPEDISEMGDAPDAIFVGGGLGKAGVLDAAWTALKPGGRLVANAVTLEGEQSMLAFRQKNGGDLQRIDIEKASPIGSRTAFRPMMTVTQISLAKDDEE